MDLDYTTYMKYNPHLLEGNITSLTGSLENPIKPKNIILEIRVIVHTTISYRGSIIPPRNRWFLQGTRSKWPTNKKLEEDEG